MTRIALAAFALVCAARTRAGARRSADDLARRTVERRAVEAVIWGMPAVNYDLMLQEMLSKTNGKVGQVIYWAGRSTGTTRRSRPIRMRSTSWCSSTRRTGRSSSIFRGRRKRIVQRQYCHGVADAARGRRTARRRQGQGRQIPDPAAGLQRQGSGRHHRSAVRHARRLHAVPREPQEPQRRRRPGVHCLRQADENLSAVAGCQSACDRLHRREGYPFRQHHPLRRELLRASRPGRAERALARPRPRHDRSAQVARHREGQAFRSR